MIKYVACTFILLGTCGFGLFKVLDYHKRYREMVYIRYVIHTMLIEMENHRETFGETCLAVSKKIKEPYSAIFYQLYHLLEQERQESPKDYWEKKIEDLSQQTLVRDEEKRILKGMIRCADCNIIAMPLEILREALAEWDKVILSAERIKNEKSKVTLCLSVSAGLILCITIL